MPAPPMAPQNTDSSPAPLTWSAARWRNWRRGWRRQFVGVLHDATERAATDRARRENAERLPVIDSPADRKLIGWISKRDLLGVYSQEIMHKRQLLGHFVVREGDEKRDVFVELPEGFELRTLELPAHLNGRTLAELAPRSSYSVHILVIKRRDPVTGRNVTEMPEPTTRLFTGDDLVVIGKDGGLEQFVTALAPTVENSRE